MSAMVSVSSHTMMSDLRKDFAWSTACKQPMSNYDLQLCTMAGRLVESPQDQRMDSGNSGLSSRPWCSSVACLLTGDVGTLTYILMNVLLSDDTAQSTALCSLRSRLLMNSRLRNGNYMQQTHENVDLIGTLEQNSRPKWIRSKQSTFRASSLSGLNVIGFRRDISSDLHSMFIQGSMRQILRLCLWAKPGRYVNKTCMWRLGSR